MLVCVLFCLVFHLALKEELIQRTENMQKNVEGGSEVKLREVNTLI